MPEASKKGLTRQAAESRLEGMRKYRLTLHAIESEMREVQSYQKLREPYPNEETHWTQKGDGPNPQFGYVPTVARVDVSRDVFVMELTDIDTTKLLRAVLDVASDANK